MLELYSVLTFILNSINAGDERVTIIDDEHILDNKTGVKYHMYDEWFKITRDDVEVMTMRDLAPQEQTVIWEIKQAITDPDVARQRKLDCPKLMRERRKAFSELYEDPQPLLDVTAVVESDTTEYTG